MIDWDSLIPKLDSVYKDDKETLARVLFYLGEEDNQYKEANEQGPAMRILNSAINVANLFTEYAKRLADDTKKAETDTRFKRLLGLIYAQMLEADKHVDDEDRSPNLPLAIKMEQASFSACPGLVRAMSVIPFESQKKMLAMMGEILPTNVLTTVEGVVQTVNKLGGTVVMAALATVQLTYEAIMNINLWWKGEITGVRCCKNIIDSLAAVGGSIGGGLAGVAAGAVLGPVGMLIGGVAGGIAGGELARSLSDWLTQNIFDIPKDVALENAYNYFGLRRDASNHDINTAYREKCLEHHPDKGGSSEKFHIVQINLAVIKAAKGELYD